MKIADVRGKYADYCETSKCNFDIDSLGLLHTKNQDIKVTNYLTGKLRHRSPYEACPSLKGTRHNLKY